MFETDDRKANGRPRELIVKSLRIVEKSDIGSVESSRRGSERIEDPVLELFGRDLEERPNALF